MRHHLSPLHISRRIGPSLRPQSRCLLLHRASSSQSDPILSTKATPTRPSVVCPKSFFVFPCIRNWRCSDASWDYALLYISTIPRRTSLDLYRHNVPIIRSPTQFCRFILRTYPPLLILPMILGSIRSFLYEDCIYLRMQASAPIVPLIDDVSPNLPVAWIRLSYRTGRPRF